MKYEQTVTELFEQYIQECQYLARLRFETIRGYKAVFFLFCAIMPEVETIDALTAETIVEFFRRLETRERLVGKRILRTGIKSSTIKTYSSKLNSFCEWLQRKELLKMNPFSKIKAPETVYADQRAIITEDVKKLYSAITLHSQDSLNLRRDTAMVSLLLFCGLRLSEFIGLEVRDIDFERQLLTVRGTTSKSLKTRYIPLHPTLTFHLKDYIVERNKRFYKTHYLIVSANTDKGLSRHGLKHWVKNLGKKSGVKFHLHQFRHAFACNLATKDVNAIKIQKLLGHSSLNMTMTYLRSITTEDLKEEINRLSI